MYSCISAYEMIDSDDEQAKVSPIAATNLLIASDSNPYTVSVLLQLYYEALKPNQIVHLISISIN